eukprot:GILK01006595.1.p1 GENE.GILK01006595.1~~GILK01006595.1.p1  ORF type:complete len:424 (-),score=61.67 GILK01006595.1:211-1482(-)
MSSKVIAIVDPASSGNGLAPIIKAAGHTCVAVLNANTPQVLMSSLRLTDFDHIVRHDGDLKKTMKDLRALNIHSIIAGCEPSVELADALSEGLGLRSNGTAMSHARRNKYDMQEALRERGLRAVFQRQSSKWEEVSEWATELNDWPVILKPIRSAGTDGVRLCHNTTELRDAFDAVCGKYNCLGELNDAVLVQEYLRGTEYVVDTVSLDGRHHVTSYWKYEKKNLNGSIIYCSIELLPSEGIEQDCLRPYIFKCLDALGVRHGPAHSEVMLCADGPCLVETGARMHGEKGPYLASQCIGTAQLELTADVYINNELFNQVAGKPYVLKKTLLESFLISKKEGRLASSLVTDSIRSLPGFYSMTALVQVGEMINKTVDLFSSPGRVVLMHENEEVVRRGYESLRSLEQSGLYDVLDDCTSISIAG